MLVKIINPGNIYTTICDNEMFIIESGLSKKILSKAHSSILFSMFNYRELCELEYKFITKIKSDLIGRILFVLYNQKYDVYIIIGSEGVGLKEPEQLELFK